MKWARLYTDTTVLCDNQFQDRAFPVAVVRAWNSLSPTVMSSTSLLTFKERSKAELCARHDSRHIVFWNVILKFIFKLYVTLITFVNNNNNNNQCQILDGHVVYAL